MGAPASESPFFPQTTWTVLLQAKDPTDPLFRESIDRLCRAYWRPVYWWIRKKLNCNHQDAHDLTQEFFANALEQHLFRSVSPEKGRFRIFLLVALRNFLTDQHRYRTALKRGGGRRDIPLDEMETHQPGWEPLSRDLSPEQAYFLSWRESVVRQAWEDVQAALQAAGKPEYAEIFRRLVLETPADGPPSHKDLARELGLSLFDIGNRLAYVKHLFRSAVKEKVRGYVSSEEEVEKEIQDLFGSGE